ncbi:MAG: Hsp20/alpha crystallin family protein [Candidatus Kariarchaeaceae archaeon]
MSLVRYYNPLTELRRMARGFDAFFTENEYLAPLDLIESEEGFTVQVNLPGFTKEEISVEADYEHLTISAEHVEEKEESGEESDLNYLRKERAYGKFSRKVHFRKPIDAKEAQINLENGVLTISIPKAEEAKSVNLTIN